MAFVFMVPSITMAVVAEKETGIRELLKLNGLQGWMQWLGWMLNSVLVLMISVTIVVVLLFIDLGGGGVYQYGDPAVWWTVLMLYIMSATTYCFFIASFFKKPALATTGGIILWFALYQFPLDTLEPIYDTSSLTIKMAFAFLPNMGLYLALKVMSTLEGTATGIQWSNIGEPISDQDSLSLLHIIFMQLLSTVIYMFLTVYLENVLPSEFGVRQPFYYLILPSSYCQIKGTSNKVGDGDDDGNSNAAGFEEETSTAPVGVDIRNLRKKFGSNKVAVDGVTVKMYDGEIFALLGHNGAGKTTTISMISGMFAPSSGTAIVNGYDITTALDKARSSLGLCPQHNMLFDKLTVREHLLKGLSSSAASNEATMLMPKLQLAEKSKTISRALSGGQMRKLCLGIALIGGSKVVILDEPTSGLDPEARRVIWDLLLEMRGQRTIILTTHFMEEADVLGDRLGIMAAGKLHHEVLVLIHRNRSCLLWVTHVSQEILRSWLHVEIICGRGCETRSNSPSRQKYVTDASVKSSHVKKSSEILITLPTETASTFLSELFTELSQQKDQLGIQTVGLSLTSIDEVFLRVGELTDGHAGQDSKNSESTKSMAPTSAPSKGSGLSKKSSKHKRKHKHEQEEHEEGDADDSDAQPQPEQVINTKDEKQRMGPERLVGLKLTRGQFVALLKKKYIYSYRNWKFIFPQLIIPVFLISLAILISGKPFKPEPPLPPLQLDGVSQYSNLVTLASSSDPPLSSDDLAAAIGSSYKEVPSGKSLSEALLNAATSNLADYRKKYIVAVEGTSSGFNAMFNTIPNHAARWPSIWRQLGSKTRGYLDETRRRTTPQVVLFGLFMPIGLGMLAASFIVFPIEEKLCQAKQLQMMTGVSPLTYWFSAFLWDFCLVLLVICLMTLCFPIFEKNAIYTAYWGAVVAFLILLVYGCSAIWHSYVFSLFSSSVSGGFGLVSIIHIICGVMLSLVVYALEGKGKTSLAIRLCKFFGRTLSPAYGAAIATIKFASVASTNSRCNLISEEANSFICDSSRNIGPEYRACCDNCQQLPGVTCFKPDPYIEWNGIGVELVIMIVMAFVYLTILMVVELRILQGFFATKGSGSVFVDSVTDEDVVAEKQRVTDMIKNGKTDEDALVVENLCKRFGNFSAVSKLSFGVHHGECFGLLGVNGAGKTTTFRMLTGDEIRTCGNAHAFMKTLEKNRQEFLSNIGYCPQFDGIVGVLSGKQMLHMFGRLRGVPGNVVGVEADKWLKKMGLDQSANVQCRKYSGGMKRRLSVAMAAIGEPVLLFLDEPTSGVDPVSRRQFWVVLSSIRDAGQAIILTSHSMDECEALCSRLAIMVNGQLQCLGGIPHLKNKFVQGYSLSIKLKPTVEPESEQVVSLRKEIEEKFQPCTLKDQHLNNYLYQLKNTALDWSVLFKTMEEIKTSYQTSIEEYSINETSLEEVFLSFARQQYGDRKVEESKLKRCLKCKCCS
ncbi:ATP-binding cassette sub-family A member 3 [Orchesella cincta]|uniref:ATP-binding cassette sub-family A member 3 n=1 Tax=Orchesella cincta TaxID=48709 RepID=A0A1D2MR76_ORCCI|nr:ATP-binding cassette sub-family A member 3 [Orchesella cincta]